MRELALNYLVCPICQGNLKIGGVLKKEKDIFESGDLRCDCCEINFPIIGGIPRFVPSDNYASGFGLQWNIHSKTQYDSYTGLNITEYRFFQETRWPRDLSEQTILEVGCGSGRFTEQVASTKAFVVSMDYSNAVEANYQAHREKENVLIVQADIYNMPFPRNFFDKLFCFGVLQHTPDVKKAFMALPAMLRPGGEMVVDIYKKTVFSVFCKTKYYVRPFTRDLDAEKLYNLCKTWVDFVWPLCSLIRKIPQGGRINFRFLAVADHSAYHPSLRGRLLKEWAYLNTFDMMGPRYDSPQTLATMRRWFQETGLRECEVTYGYNGIEGRGRK
jgi:SAM-dependent methyltransferase/uncharacterized protein YbaR (Trm112 family)